MWTSSSQRKDDAASLYRKLKSEPGWKRHAEGFKNSLSGVSVDIRVEGERTSSRRLRTAEARGRLDDLAVRAKDELARRR